MAIPETTQACALALKDLRDLPTASQTQRTWAEDQLARLNLWADSLGVFAEGEFSVNRRLARNKQVAQLVKQLLEALLGNIQGYRTALTHGPAPPDSSKTSNAEVHADSSAEETSDSESDENEKGSIGAKRASKIADGLSRLLQLAVRVRREGAKKTNEEAAKFEPKDESGKPLATEFELYVESVCERTFKQRRANDRATGEKEGGAETFGVAPFLQERAKRCMLDRWRRLCYRRHHASDLARPNESATARPDLSKPKTKPTAPPLVTRDSSRPQGAPAQKIASLPVASKAVSAATSLPEHVKIDKKTDLHPKTAPTVTTKVRADHLVFPRAPVVREGVDVFICTLCGLPCPKDLLEKRKWQVHVMQDLLPYFCLFEDCGQPYRTFQTTEEWLNHTKADHARTSWVCQMCRSPGATGKQATFHDEAAYRQHLEQVHPSIAVSQLALVVQMSCNKEAPIYPCCQFCGFVPEAHLLNVEDSKCQLEITTHMAKSHLQPFALDSIPWDIAGADNDDSGKVSGSSVTDSLGEVIRQQIMNDSTLEAFKAASADADSLTALSADGKVYAASLEEIRRRWGSRIDSKEFRDSWREKIAADYSIIERDALLGLAETAVAWARMGEDAPETVLLVSGPQNLDSDATKGEGGPLRQGRKRSVAPLVTKERTELDSRKEPQPAYDVHSETEVTEIEKRFLDLVRQGQLEGVSDFLSKMSPDFNVDCDDERGFRALHLAALNGSPEMIKTLFDAGCGIDRFADEVATPLHLAVAQDSFEAANALLESGVFVDVLKFGLGTALHAACLLQRPRVVQLLLDKGADVNCSSFVDFDYVQTFQNLEPLGVCGGKDATSSHSEPPLHQNPNGSITSIVHGAPLAIAGILGSVDIIRILIQHGASVDAEARWQSVELHVLADECTPLTLACRSGESEAARILLNAGANIDHEDGDGDDAALNAVYSWSFETVQVLVQHVSSADKRRTKFGPALIKAAERGLIEIVRFLLAHDVTADFLGGEIGRTPLMSASSNGQCDVMNALLQSGASVDKINSMGRTALFYAVSDPSGHAIAALLAAGADINHTDNTGYTALMASTGESDPACLRELVDHQADLHLQDENGADALSYAACREQKEQAQILIERGARVDAPDIEGWTPLIVAAAWNSHAIARLLIEHGANVEHQTFNTLDTALSKAAQFGSLEAAQVLIESGAALDTKNQKGNTALFEAAARNNPEVLKLLIESGSALDGEDDKGDTVLMTTVNAGHIECLQILIEAGATSSASQRVWELALLLAAGKGNVACLSLLLPKSQPDVRNDEGMTALMLAVSEGHKECARLLLEAKAAVDLSDDLDRTALHYAAKDRQAECMRLLLDHGASHSLRDRDGRTPFLLLAAEGKEGGHSAECVRALLDAGVSITDTDKNDRSALWLAVHDGDDEVLEALCCIQKLDKDAFDEHGETALMFAAKFFDFSKHVKALMEGGANVDLQNPKNGRNALAYALSLWNYRGAAVLMKAGSTLSKVVAATDSGTLLELKEGLDRMTTFRDDEDCSDLVKSSLRDVMEELGVRKWRKDPVLTLKPHQKERLFALFKAAKQRLRSKRKFKSVSFAPVNTPESGENGDESSKASDDSGDGSSEDAETGPQDTLFALNGSLDAISTPASTAIEPSEEASKTKTEPSLNAG